MLLGEGRKINPIARFSSWAGVYLGIALLGLPLPEIGHARASSAPTASTTPISPAALSAVLSQSIPKVREFAAIRELGRKHGLKVWLFGGTASTFAHYVRWFMEYQAGSTTFDPNLLDFHYSNIYRSTQDLDLVVDGTSDAKDAFEKELTALFPYIQGGHREKWEIRLLRESSGGKDVLLGNADFILQHSDSNSTGLIELTQPTPGDPISRDLREWTVEPSTFLRDVAQGQIHYYYSDKHLETDRFVRGMNPEIFSVIRLLTKVVQFDLTLSSEDEAHARDVIARFNPLKEVTHGYVATWIEKNARKLLLNALDLERASKLLDDYGLRQKLNEIPHAEKLEEGTLHWWLNRKPLPSFPIRPAKPGQETAKSLKLTTIAHATNSFASFESIMMTRSGLPNFFISREKAEGELAAYGEGLYAQKGLDGAGNSDFTIRMEMNPDAVLGVDFQIVAGTLEYVLLLNRNAARVLPQSLSVSPSEWYTRLSEDSFEKSDAGLVQKMKTRIDTDLLHLDSTEAQKVLQVFKDYFYRGTSHLSPEMVAEWFRIRGLLPPADLPIDVEANVIMKFLDGDISYNEDATYKMVAFLAEQPPDSLDQAVPRWFAKHQPESVMPVLIRLTRAREEISVKTWIKLFTSYYHSTGFQTGKTSELAELKALLSEKFKSLSLKEKKELKTVLKQSGMHGKDFRSLDLFWAIPDLSEILSPLELLQILGGIRSKKWAETWDTDLDLVFNAGVKSLTAPEREALVNWVVKRYNDGIITDAIEWIWLRSEIGSETADAWTSAALKAKQLTDERIGFIGELKPGRGYIDAILRRAPREQFFEFIKLWPNMILPPQKGVASKLDLVHYAVYRDLLPVLLKRYQSLCKKGELFDFDAHQFFNLIHTTRDETLAPLYGEWLKSAVACGDGSTISRFVLSLRNQDDLTALLIPYLEELFTAPAGQTAFLWRLTNEDQLEDLLEWIGTPKDGAIPSTWRIAITPYLHRIVDFALEANNFELIKKIIVSNLDHPSMFEPGRIGTKVFQQTLRLAETDIEASNLTLLVQRRASVMTDAQIKAALKVSRDHANATLFKNIVDSAWHNRPLSLLFDLARTAEIRGWTSHLRPIFGQKLGLIGVREHLSTEALLFMIKFAIDHKEGLVLHNIAEYQFYDQSPTKLARHQLALQYLVERLLKLGVSSSKADLDFFAELQDELQGALMLDDYFSSSTPRKDRSKKRELLFKLASKGKSAKARLALYREFFPEIETRIAKRLQRLEAKVIDSGGKCDWLLVKPVKDR